MLEAGNTRMNRLCPLPQKPLNPVIIPGVSSVSIVAHGISEYHIFVPHSNIPQVAPKLSYHILRTQLTLFKTLLLWRKE